MNIMKCGALASSLVLAAGLCTNAAEPQGWKVEITPYAWLAGIEGDGKIKGQDFDFDKSFSDLFDAVELGGSLLGIVQYDRFLVWGQVDYFKLSTDEMDVEDQPQGGSLESKTFLGEAAVGYQIDGWMEGQTFDLLVGVRTLQIENDLEVYGQGTKSGDRDLVDPIFVVRPSIPVLPSKVQGLRFNPTLAIGGGGDSDLVYELQPQFQYDFNDSVSGRLGYRRVGYQFKEGDDELNFDFSGLIVGLGITL